MGEGWDQNPVLLDPIVWGKPRYNHQRDPSSVNIATRFSFSPACRPTLPQVSWKSRLKAQFPDPNSYSAFMGNFSSITGILTVSMVIGCRKIFEKWGWGAAAAVTPITVGITGIIFFSLILFPGMWAPLAQLMGTTPLMLAVLVGAAQNSASKASKYSLFDPCKVPAPSIWFIAVAHQAHTVPDAQAPLGWLLSHEACSQYPFGS